jgi:hypothetical protein
MQRFRFSIARLLGVVFCVAIAVPALRPATDAWESSVFGVTLLTLLIALLLCIHRTDQQRAYWAGFALFGWAYLGASLIPAVEGRLPTTKGFALLGSGWTGTISQGLALADLDNDGTVDLFVNNGTGPGGVYLNNGSGTFRNAATIPAAPVRAQQVPNAVSLGNSFRTYWRLIVATGSIENVIRTMHSLSALLFACAGGLLSKALYATGQHHAAA